MIRGDRPALSGVENPRFLRENGGSFDLDGADNVADHADKVLEYWERWFSSKERGLVHDYTHGDAYLSIDVLDCAGRHVGQLFLAGVPFGLEVVDMEMPDIAVAADSKTLVCNRKGGKHAVYLLVSDLVESVKGPIPSFVWFKLAQKEGPKFGRDGRFLPADIFRSLFLGRPEWELRVFGSPYVSDSADAIVDGMIQGGSQIAYDVECDGPQFGWNFALYSSLKKVFAGVPIFLSECGIRLARVKPGFDGVKFGNVSVRAVNQQPSIGEMNHA